jgi:hypothetical protein
MRRSGEATGSIEVSVRHGCGDNAAGVSLNGHDAIIASESEAIQRVSGTLDCFVASAQNCFAILPRASRNDAEN